MEACGEGRFCLCLTARCSGLIFAAVSDRRRIRTRSTASFELTRTLYHVLAGASMLSWQASVLGGGSHFEWDYALMLRDISGHWAAYFLLVDAVVLCAVLLLFLGLASGWAAVPRWLLLSTLLGPGAGFCLCFAQREAALRSQFLKGLKASKTA